MATPESKDLVSRMWVGWSSFRDFVHLSRYEEVWRANDRENPTSLKENFKNGRLIGSAVTVEFVCPVDYLEDEYIPPFAVGRCRVIGMGDYKVVFADRDGQSDYVIKSGYGPYKGEYAEQKARLAAFKLSQIYDIANKIVPGVVLPAEWIITEKNGEFEVYEKQQRALAIAINLLDPRTAEKLGKQANYIAIQGTDCLKDELLKRGLARKNPYFGFERITDQLDLTEIHFDLITNRLVSLDIVDRLDITPLLSPKIKPDGFDLG